MVKPEAGKCFFELSKAFHELAKALGDYRYANWDTLTQKERDDIENQVWTLLNFASDLNAQSVLEKVAVFEKDLKLLQSCADAMQRAAQKIAGIKLVLTDIAKAIALGGAIYLAVSTGNLQGVVAAAEGLLSDGLFKSE